ncbi:MAG: hypothetical protein ACJAZ1_000648 [Yoonia sp.]
MLLDKALGDKLSPLPLRDKVVKCGTSISTPSSPAIELCLTFGMVFKQPLRQTQGLMRSISKLMCVDITVPHFTTLSRRGNGLSLPPKTASKTTKPVQLVVDSTGLKIFGEGEWLEEKHKTKGKRRAWRKLRLSYCQIWCLRAVGHAARHPRWKKSFVAAKSDKTTVGSHTFALVTGLSVARGT